MTDIDSGLLILHESSAGYGLLECEGFEEIGAMLEENNTSMELGRFNRAVKLKSFQPFSSAEEALENINAISEHAATETLLTFLEMNIPKSSGKKKSSGDVKVQIGVVDPSLATAISEGMEQRKRSISCRSDDTIREIIRGCRLHFSKLVKGLDKGALEHAQLGLGHSYSRSKVKFNPARSDNMIIQSIALLDQMDKDLNTFAMRVREWYSWHFPELKEIVKDMYMYARCAAFIQNKKSLCTVEGAEEKEQGLVEILGDDQLAQSVVAAARTSMGMDCNVVDMLNIVNFSQRMVKLSEYRKELANYLSDKMSLVAPNLKAILGDVVAARLISKAGSLTNLAKAPASTVQILGAEKALFRALKTKTNTPKYGLIYHSTFIGRAAAKNKGRISRYLANKCSIATRIDSFSDEPNNAYGLKLRDQIEERLNFYETGAQPRKNIDVMEEVSRQLAVASSASDEAKGKKKRKAEKEDKEENVKSDKKKKRKEKEAVTDDMEVEEDDTEAKKSAKKKAKKAKRESSSAKKTDSSSSPPSTPKMSTEEVTETPKSKKKEKSDKKKKRKSKGN